MANSSRKPKAEDDGYNSPTRQGFLMNPLVHEYKTQRTANAPVAILPRF